MLPKPEAMYKRNCSLGLNRWGVDDLKKAEMDKTLRNGLIMSEMDPLNHKWLDLAI